MTPTIGMKCIDTSNLPLDAPPKYEAFGVTKKYIHYLYLCPSRDLSNLDNCMAVAAKITIFISPIITLIIDLVFAISHCLYGESAEPEEDEEMADGLGPIQANEPSSDTESLLTSLNPVRTERPREPAHTRSLSKMEFPRAKLALKTPRRGPTKSIFFSPFNEVEKGDSPILRTPIVAKQLLVPPTKHRRGQNSSSSNIFSGSMVKRLLHTPTPSSITSSIYGSLTPGHSSAMPSYSENDFDAIDEESELGTNLLEQFDAAATSGSTAPLPNLADFAIL